MSLPVAVLPGLSWNGRQEAFLARNTSRAFALVSEGSLLRDFENARAGAPREVSRKPDCNRSRRTCDRGRAVCCESDRGPAFPGGGGHLLRRARGALGGALPPSPWRA